MDQGHGGAAPQETIAITTPRKVYVHVELLDYGDTDSDDKRHFTQTEYLRDIVDSMEMVRGVKLGTFTILDQDGMILAQGKGYRV